MNGAQQENLIRQFRRGDTEAFRKLFNLLSRPILYIAQRIIKSPEVADEIISDSFMQVWKAREQFMSMANVKAYLYVVTRNSCLNHVQASRQRMRHRPIAEDDLTSEPEVLAHILRAELYEAIHSELECLTPKQAAVFRMSVLEGLRTDEICEALNISPGSVFTHRSAAIKAIRHALRQKHTWLIALYYFSFFS